MNNRGLMPVRKDTIPAHPRILVRGLNWLGDAVMSTPALLRLRQAYPASSITLVTAEKLADLWQNHPALDDMLTFTPRDGVLAISRRLRAASYDLGLILPNSFRSALELWLGGVPERIGYGRQGRAFLLTKPVASRRALPRMRKRSPREVRALVASDSLAAADNQPGQCPESPHHIHDYLHLFGQMGADPAPIAPFLFVGKPEVESFLKRFGLADDPARPLLGLNPGAEYGPAKRWPAEKFIAAACRIQEFTGGQWLVFGGRSDLELAGRITSGIETFSRNLPPGKGGAVNLAGATSLRELVAGLRVCRVLLTNDTGPMHVAAAVGTPVIAPFGSTSADLTGPGLPGDTRHRPVVSSVPCAPCFLRSCPIDFRCMEQITVEEVVGAARSCIRQDG
jgi:heptosyltransferase II